MDHALSMRMSQSGGGLHGAFASRGDRQRATRSEPMIQVEAIDVFHDQEVGLANFVGVVGSDDVGVIECGGGLDFAMEASHGSRVVEQAAIHDFERYDAIHHRVLCFEDDAHAAFADAVQQPVATEIEGVSPGEQLARLPGSQMPRVDESLGDSLRVEILIGAVDPRAEFGHPLVGENIALLEHG